MNSKNRLLIFFQFAFILLIAGSSIGLAQSSCNKPNLPSSSAASPSGSSGGNTLPPSCSPPKGDQALGGNDNDLGFEIQGIGAWDPNLIITPIGFDSARWVSINDNIGVSIYFENDPKLATAPVHNAYIYYQFSPKQDATSFRLGNFGFNGMIFTIPPNLNYYSVRLDLTDSLGLFVDFTAGINVINNSAFFIFQSIDPITNLPPIDPTIGFLPVRDSTISALNDTVALPGQGFVTFTARPAATDVTRDTIFAQAQIVFDTNDTIPTNIEFNTVDALPPHDTLLGSIIAPFTIQLIHAGQDDFMGSGIRDYDLYVAEDSLPYILYRSKVTDTIVTFIGAPGKCYHFFGLATDNTGNREALKAAPDYTYCFKGNAPFFTFNNSSTNTIALTACNANSQTICFTVGDPDGDIDSIVIDQSPVNGNAVLNVVNDTVYVNYIPSPGFSGNDSLTINACDTAGHCSTLQINITVLPVINATISANTTQLCTGDSALLAAQPIAGVSYQWLYNNISISGATDSIYYASAQGDYSLQVMDSCGNDTSSVVTIFVAGSAPVALVTVNGSTTFCQGDSVQLIADTSIVSSIQWMNNGNIINGATNYIYTAFNPGNYQLFLNNGCGTDTSAITTITVDSLPQVFFFGFNADTLCIIGNNNDTLTGIPPGGAFSGNGVSGNVFIPVNAGLGMSFISYSYTDSLGCSNTFTDSIVVDSCSTVGIAHSNNQNSFLVFPNPTEELINLNGTGVTNGNYLVELTNTLGQVFQREVIKVSGEKLEFQLSLKGNSQGIYFLRIQSDTMYTIIKVEKF